MMIYLDTHVVVWLYQSETKRLNNKVCEIIEENDLMISPMILLELQYLVETNRITAKPIEIYNNLKASINLQTCGMHFEDVVNLAMTMIWTRDPFDRIIVSQAAVKNSILISKDSSILQNYSKAVWN